ncbi:MAG: Methionine synthase (cobalamin-dependent), methyltransferase domain [Herbinix sp.]|jgi:homocysteine S-methyltransferase|nr:Methionine synthase (cobalamin-dependent), methyltransferase domain [Herbinix sp.]
MKEFLKDNHIIPDGSMGTYYSQIVNQPGAISEFANLSSPAVIERIHTEYLNAGARILRTNTFAANRAVLNMKKEEQISLIRAACKIAKSAAGKGFQAENNRERIWIFGDIGPIPEDAASDTEEVLKEYQLYCDIFLEEGLDGIHFETFATPSYIEKLVSYIKRKKEEMFLLTSFSINKNGFTEAGISVSRLFDRLSKIEGIDGYGLNCGLGSGHMYQMLKRLELPGDKILYAAPNAGYPQHFQSRMVFMDNAQYFAENMQRIAKLGIDILGGCCGTTPEYISSLNLKLEAEPIVKIRPVGAFRAKVSRKRIKENDLLTQLEAGKKVIAVELDPPYDADIDQVMECAHKLKNSGCDIITFADSPMGRSRVDSILMSIKIAEETGLNVMPHLCCRDRNMISMRSVLLGGYIHGLRNLLIVTGDPVPGENRTKTTGVFDYNSTKLMEYVKEMNLEHFSKDPFCYGGALNHNRGSVEKIAERMLHKMEAGASYFLTQPVYSLEDVHRIQELKERTGAKILCGIMPLISYRNACFIKNEISGIKVPDEIVARYQPDMSKEEAEQVGATIAIEVMEMLDKAADGYYFMLPFNRVSLMEKIWTGTKERRKQDA